MKNLLQKSVRNRYYDQLKNGVQLSCTSLNDNHVFVKSGNKILRIKDGNEIQVVCECIQDICPFELIGFGHLADIDKLCLAFENGNIYLEEDFGQFELKTELDLPISSMHFSPETDQFLIITKSEETSSFHQFFLFDSFLTIIGQEDLHANHEGAVNRLNVGWGSKETQFHGSVGKQAAKAVKKPCPIVDEKDDRSVQVTFTGDGAYFAICVVDIKENYRKIRIYDKEGILQYTAEDVAGLGSVLAWKPLGNLIATNVKENNNSKIVLLERNGLKFGEFDLPKLDHPYEIKKLSWASDSSCLFVHAYVDQVKQHLIWLYTTKNYHWYCKQTITLPESTHIHLQVDPEIPLKFTVFLDNGQVIIYEFIFAINSIESTVAVIDGQKLLMTTFDSSLVPPPMCAYEIMFKQQVNQVAFFKDVLYAYLSNQDVVKIEQVQKLSNLSNDFVTINFQAISASQPGRSKIYANSTLQLKTASFLHYYMTPLDDHCIAFLNAESNPNYMVFYKDNQKLSTKKFSSSIFSISDSKRGLFVIQDTEKNVYNLDINSLDDIISSFQAPELFDQLSIQQVNQKIIIFGISSNHSLYCGSTLISNGNCNSFLIHQEKFLMFTTTEHEFKTIRLHKLLDCFEKQTLMLLEKDIFTRSIERGASLVISSSLQGHIVLQMPRGNLEIVSPRILLLDLLTQQIERLHFKSAFLLMKKHRINLNLLVDHNLQMFLDNCHHFVEQLSTLDSLDMCLFLAELTEEDVSSSLYGYFYDNLSKEKENNETKLDLVCTRLKICMDEQNAEKFFIPSLLTYIKKTVPEVGKVLIQIRNTENSTLRESALKYLMYIMDVNKLFDEALGTYDFDTALMVAYKSNKDPKEFVPFINSLRDIQSPSYQKYKVDLFLKRYKKAISWITSDDLSQYEDEFLNLVEKTRLYQHAIVCLNQNYKYQVKVWEKYADYLFYKKYFEEATIAYKKANLPAMAIKAAQLSGNWHQAVECAALQFGNLDLEKPEVTSLLKALVENLKADNRFSEAASICEIYLKDIESTIRTLIEGHLWDAVFRQICIHSRNDLRQEAMDMMSEQFNRIREDIQSDLEALIKHTNRLQVVRENKRLGLNKERDLDDFDYDGSITSGSSIGSSRRSKKSSASGSANSLATRKTNKLSRKEIRKYQLREGSLLEDLGLINEIKQILLKVDKQKKEVKLLLQSLFDTGKEEEAKALYLSFTALLNQVNKSLGNVWTDLDEEGNIPKIEDPDLREVPKFKPREWKLMLCEDWFLQEK